MTETPATAASDFEGFIQVVQDASDLSLDTGYPLDSGSHSSPDFIVLVFEIFLVDIFVLMVFSVHNL
jgi:hypothetical protein